MRLIETNGIPKSRTFEQAVQRSLVDHRAGQKRVAIHFQRDGQAIRPVHRLLTEMALYPALIDRGVRLETCSNRSGLT